jgi:hypothetical protein
MVSFARAGGDGGICTPPRPDGGRNHGHGVSSTLDGVEVRVALLDLDPKPASKIAHYVEQDREVVACFLRDCTAVGQR